MTETDTSAEAVERLTGYQISSACEYGAAPVGGEWRETSPEIPEALWVRASDYDALVAKVEALEAENAHLEEVLNSYVEAQR